MQKHFRSSRNHLFNYLTLVLRQEERDTILKSLSSHTMLITPQHSAHLVVQSQFLNTMVGPNFSTPWSDPNFSPSWSELNFNCLPQWQTTQLSAYMVQSQLPTDSFSNLQILRTITSGYDVIHTPAPFPIGGLL